MDIRRALLRGLEHQRVDPANDRRLVVGVEHVDELLGLELAVVPSSFFVPSSSSAPPRSREYVLLMWSTILPARRDHGLDRLASSTLTASITLDRVRIGDRDHHATVGVAAERQHAALTREVESAACRSARPGCPRARQLRQERHVDWIASARAS